MLFIYGWNYLLDVETGCNHCYRKLQFLLQISFVIIHGQVDSIETCMCSWVKAGTDNTVDWILFALLSLPWGTATPRDGTPVYRPMHFFFGGRILCCLPFPIRISSAYEFLLVIMNAEYRLALTIAHYIFFRLRVATHAGTSVVSTLCFSAIWACSFPFSR